MSLLIKGANINAQNKFGKTPLHLAIITGREKITKLLINAGADVNAIDQCRWTPLYLAARYRRTETTELLLSRGAKVKESEYISLIIFAIVQLIFLNTSFRFFH